MRKHEVTTAFLESMKDGDLFVGTITRIGNDWCVALKSPHRAPKLGDKMMCLGTKTRPAFQATITEIVRTPIGQMFPTWIVRGRSIS